MARKTGLGRRGLYVSIPQVEQVKVYHYPVLARYGGVGPVQQPLTEA